MKEKAFAARGIKRNQKFQILLYNKTPYEKNPLRTGLNTHPTRQSKPSTLPNDCGDDPPCPPSVCVETRNDENRSLRHSKPLFCKHESGREYASMYVGLSLWRSTHSSHSCHDSPSLRDWNSGRASSAGFRLAGFAWSEVNRPGDGEVLCGEMARVWRTGRVGSRDAGGFWAALFLRGRYTSSHVRNCSGPPDSNSPDSAGRAMLLRQGLITQLP